MQETAIRTAVEQAELRRGIRDILLSLARRSQALVHRQLTLLDSMDRREDDSKELEDLFHVDHLATRMRRNAENLIVLSGATPARGWRRPVPMIDVVRSSVAEVEDYTRVTVMPMGEVALAGRAVGDIVHLLAELIENAVSFSPPYTQAQVSGHPVAHGYVVEIEDRGLGMTDEIQSLAKGVGERFGGGPIRQTVVEMRNAYLLVTVAGQGACLAVLSTEEADIGLIAYEMAMLVTGLGHHLSAASRTPEQTS